MMMRRVFSAIVSAETTGPDGVARDMVEESIPFLRGATIAGYTVERVFVPVPLHAHIAIHSDDGDTTTATVRVRLVAGERRRAAGMLPDPDNTIFGTDCRCHVLG